MVVKPVIPSVISSAQFESSVNSYGGKTLAGVQAANAGFESSVNSYGGKTNGNTINTIL